MLYNALLNNDFTGAKETIFYGLRMINPSY